MDDKGGSEGLEPPKGLDLLWVNQGTGDANPSSTKHRKVVHSHRRAIQSHVMHNFQRKKSSASIARLKSKTLTVKSLLDSIADPTLMNFKIKYL